MSKLYKNKKIKIILCFFGVIPRSIKYTFQSIKTNLIDILKKNFIVNIYVFNLNVGDIKVDKVKIDNKDINIIPFDYFEEYNQSVLDIKINTLRKLDNYESN